MSVPEIPWNELTSPMISELAECSRMKNEEGIVSCLVRIKRDSKRCQEFIKQTDNLLVLVEFLQSRNHAILNTCLSILADACLLSDVRDKIKHSKIGHNVTVIIKNPKLNSKIYCRAYRLIGNLSKCSWHAKVLYTAGVVKALEQCLVKSSKINVEWFTHLMAVRAAGNIWSVCTDSREEIIKNEIVRLVASIFILAEKETNYKLMDECLKALCKFLDTFNYQCGNQIQVDSKNQGYKSLIHYCKTSNNIMAIKCLFSLCQIDQCRLYLGIAGAIEQFIDMINSEHIHKEILYSLCLFCLESVNRDRIKIGGGLQAMLAVLEKSKYEHYHLILMQAILQFKFDEDALRILTKNGILNILAAKLTDMAAMAAEKTNKVSKKRSNDCSLEDMRTSFKYYQNKMGRFSMDFFGRDDWSPRSASSSSPPGTPSSSLSPASYMENDDLEDNIYSPVCSGTESNDSDEDEEASSLGSCKSLTIKSLSDKCDFDLGTPSMSCKDCTLLLLITLSRFRSIDGLAHSAIIMPLLKFIKYTIVNDAQRKAVRILKNITENPEYFVSLLRNGLIFEVQNLPDSEEYTEFILRTITGSAIGHLGFSLLREHEDYKLLTAVSIPLLIKDYHNLNLLLEKHGGLKLIFRLLRESLHKLHERAIWSICQLAKSLKIHPVGQLIVEESYDYSIPPSKTDYAKPTVSPTVTFVLDDDSTVEACRQTLCQRSEVFSAMLNGNFSESGKRRVQLKDTSRDGLNTLILAASGATFEQESIESLLDAVLLADKFLMLDLTKPLIKSCIAKLNYESFCQAWKWARKNSCHEWRSYCVMSFLTAEMSWSQTMQAFRDFYATDAFDDFLHEVRMLIVEKLKI